MNRVDKWMDGWMDKQGRLMVRMNMVDGWMDEQGRWVDEQLDGWINRVG